MQDTPGVSTTEGGTDTRRSTGFPYPTILRGRTDRKPSMFGGWWFKTKWPTIRVRVENGCIVHAYDLTGACAAWAAE